MPRSRYLLFDFKNKNTKSWFKTNLGKVLQRELRITIAGEVIYDNTGENILSTYKDLWLKENVRSNMIEDGIGSLAIRKRISKDDAQNDDAEAKIAFETYGTKQRIHLSKIIKDHGLYSSSGLNHSIKYEIKLSDAVDIMEAQSGANIDGYALENLELEYETIDNAEIAKNITQRYMVGRSLSYEHVTLLKNLKNWIKL